jgi:HD superfamily phosphohydrolase
MARKFKRIRTLLYADQRFYRGELDLLHTPLLQRLYELHQLGLTDRVFIDASHSRLHHVVGVMEQAQKLCTALRENLLNSKDFRPLKVRGEMNEVISLSFDELAKLVEDRTAAIRLIGLLHDLTHAPFGHTVEDEIELIACKHDEPARQAEAFYRLICQYLAWLGKESGRNVPGAIAATLSPPFRYEAPDPATVVSFAVAMLKETASNKPPAWELPANEVVDLLANILFAMTALLHLELLHAKSLVVKHFPKKEYPFQRVLAGILNELAPVLLADYRFVPRRDAFMLDLIGNTVCADLLDYAQRDSHFANLKTGYDSDRIAENFTLVTWNACDYPHDPRPVLDDKQPLLNEDGQPLADPFSGSCVRTAISLYSHKLRVDVPSELMNLLNVRFYLYERALFHPTKCAAGAMLGTALQLLGINSLKSSSPTAVGQLPDILQYGGDTAFIENIYTASLLAISAIRAVVSQHSTMSQGDLLTWQDAAVALLHADIEVPQANIARSILLSRRDSTAEDTLKSFEAACELLMRLTSRRFYRPVFRTLPNAHNTLLRMEPKNLAPKFSKASVRFKAERAIEDGAAIPRGSIVIHCPRINTAQKIANVLLFLPEDDLGHGKVNRLRDIGQLDSDVFGAHERAIRAVEEMYPSMWRLVVYVAPEYLARWPEVAKVAGSVIFKACDSNDEHPDGFWENDRHLERELDKKYLPRKSDNTSLDPGQTESQRLISIGAIAPEDEANHTKKALRPQAILRLVLPLLGKDKLERREEKIFSDFSEQNVSPMETDEFLSWHESLQSELAEEKKDLQTAIAGHFKAGDMTTVISRLTASIQQFKVKLKK